MMGTLFVILAIGGVVVVVWQVRDRCNRLEEEVSHLRRLLRRLEDRLDAARPTSERAPDSSTMEEAEELEEPEAAAAEESEEISPDEPEPEPVDPAVSSWSTTPPTKVTNDIDEKIRRMVAARGRWSTPDADEPAAPEPAASWEERLGARLPVWIGAVALALAGVFLVRHFAQRGLFGPPVQVGLAGLFGLAMLGGGEWLRRSQGPIAQALTAAGVAVLYAAVLAAVSLHGLIGPTVGFGLMAAVTAAAVGLSLRQGPFVALLGLVGGFLMPGLLGVDDLSVVQLFGYLFLLEIGLTVLTRGRRWWTLTLLTMLGGFGWAALWLALWYDPAQSTAVGLFLLASIAAFVLASIDIDERIRETRISDLIPCAAVAAGLLLVGWLVRAAEFPTLEWAYLGLLGLGCLVLGRLRARYAPMAWLAAGMGLVLLGMWAGQDGAALGERFNWIVLAFGILWGGGAYAALWGAARPAGWAWLSVLAAVGHMLVGYWLIETPVTALPWWVGSLLLAGAYAVASVPVALRRRWIMDGDATLAALLIGATAFVSIAAPMELQRQWIAVAWAVEMPFVALIALWLGLPRLRWAVITLAGLAAVALLLNPFVLRYPIGEHWLWNWLPYGYGVPAVAFAIAAWLTRRRRDANLASYLEAGAIAFAFVMVTLMVRHGFHPEDLLEGGRNFIEHGTYGVLWLAMGLALLAASGRWTQPAPRYGARIVAGLGLAAAFFGPGLLANPVLTDQAIGPTIIWNGLLYAFGVPALMAATAAWLLDRRVDEDLAPWFEAGAIGLVVLMATLMIHHGFHPADMTRRDIGLFEYGTFSAVWGVLGLTLLALAYWRPRPVWTTGGRIITMLGVAAAVIGPGLLANPLWNHEPVGTIPVLNGLFYLYGLPAVIAVVAAWRFKRTGPPPLITAAAMSGLLLMFGLITLEVRQAFHGTYLDGPTPSHAEWYAYSAVWILFAAALLAVGVVTRSRLLRYASLAVMLVSVLKVFLFDTGHLADLWRVLSYLGLGVSLLLLAWVYQRFVFGKGRVREEGEAMRG